MILRAHGLAVEVPRGWDCRILRRAESVVAGPGLATASAVVPQSGTTDPVVHLASFALPEGRGDYGSGAVALMGPDDVFVALVEFDAASAGTALFASKGMPRVRASEFSTTTMQRPIANMGGVQRFFTVSGRAFCCYAVVGSLARRASLAPEVNRALAGVSVERAV